MELKMKTIPLDTPDELFVCIYIEKEGNPLFVGGLRLTRRQWKYFNRVMDEGSKEVEKYQPERKTLERMK